MSAAFSIDVRFSGDEAALARAHDIVAGIVPAIAAGEPYPDEYAFLWDSFLSKDDKLCEQVLEYVWDRGLGAGSIDETTWSVLVQIAECLCENVPQLDVSGTMCEHNLTSGTRAEHMLFSPPGQSYLDIVEEGSG